MQRRGLFCSVLIFLITFNITAQERYSQQLFTKNKDSVSRKKVIFYKYNNTTRKVNLLPGRTIGIWLKDSLEHSEQTILTSRIYSENDSTLFVYEGHLNITTARKNLQGENEVNKDFYYYFPADSIIGVKLNTIKYVQAESSTFISNLGAVLLISSFTSAFIIAPAVSINYSKRTFNSDRYFNILYPSVGVFIIGLTFPIFIDHESKLKVRR